MRASNQVASAISQYAQRSQVSLDDIRQNPQAHAGNLRAEIMQATGDTQTFTGPVVDQLIGTLQGQKPNVAALDAVLQNVIARQDTHQQNVNRSMGSTLQASQGGQSRTNSGSSPLSTRMGAMIGQQNTQANPSRNATSGAQAGQQAGALGRLGRRIRTGAIALAIGASLLVGGGALFTANNTPDLPTERPAIELIQEQDKQEQHIPGVQVQPVEQQNVGNGPVMDYDKEQDHMQNHGDANAPGRVVHPLSRDGGGVVQPELSTPGSLNPANVTGADTGNVEADKDALHNAQFGGRILPTNVQGNNN